MDPHQGSQYSDRPGPSSPQTSYSSESELKTSTSGSSAKRRPSRAGTRSVSSLTPAQLERKRANDREAQRAIRQRTKDHIENLERKIAELTAGDDTSSKLMHALHRVEKLEQENAMLRSRLGQASGHFGGGDDSMAGESSMVASAARSPSARMSHVGYPQITAAPTPRLGSVPVAVTQPESWHTSHSAASMANIGAPASIIHAETPQAASNPTWPAPQQSLQRGLSHPDNAAASMQVDPSVPPQAGHGTYGYLLDAASRPTQYQTSEEVSMSYEQAHQGYGHTGYPPRTLGSDAAGYTAYQGHQAYVPAPQQQPQGQQQQQQQQQQPGSQHMMYSISRPS